ncbi:MAG: mechanosensitive ion channel family protein [Bacteroidota bacterium]|nr:mechanosensitive ion channel family protein [Bacteroidota bacterium]
MDLEFLSIEFLNNSVKDYLYFFLAIIIGLIIARPIISYLLKIAHKLFGSKDSDSERDMLKSLLRKPLYYFFLLMILYIGLNSLNFPHEWGLVDSSEFGLKMVINKGFYLAVICSIFWTILRSVEFIGVRLKDKAAQTESKVDDGLIPFAIDLTKVLVFIFAAVIILGNVFNVNITALVAGLGVGGVAIALASKESIENLLGSFTIFFDAPFAVGDVITLGGVTGKVEKVGFRSTRIRTFDKSIVTVPNKNIINTELDNLGVRPVRRVKFNIGLTYDTTIEQIKNIVNDIQKLVDDHPMTNEDGRVRFLSFGGSSLDIMVLYYVNSPDWEDLIDTQQKINYSIIEIVNKHNSEFAFPSTSVYIEKNNSK